MAKKKPAKPVQNDQSEWSEQPLDPTGRIMYRILRSRPSKPIEGVIVSHVLLGKYTHHVNGRTQPHLKRDCDGCLKGIQMRWHSWLFVKAYHDPEISMHEFPAIGANQVARWSKEYGGLRGYGIKQTRLGGKINGRIQLNWNSKRVNPDTLPPCPDIVAVLEKMWELRPHQLEARELTGEICEGNILEGHTPE